MGSEFPVWPLFAFAGLLTAIAAGIFAAVYLSARDEGKDGR
jgi:hypothetical protein